MALPELSSQLSYGALLKAFQDTSDYDLVNSVARAQIYIQAGRMMLALAIRRTGQASRAEEIEVEPEIVERQVNAAIRWLRSRNAAALPPRQIIPDECWRD
jgi:hypothetical protein